METEQRAAELERLKSEIAALRRSRRAGRPKPHKLVTLLAVLDMAEDGLLGQNRIPFDDPLLARFESHFQAYQQGDDRCHPCLPFFHLRSSGFWHHKVKPGKEAAYRDLRTARGAKEILETIEYAWLSDGAFEMVRHPATRGKLRQFVERLLDTQG